MYRQFIRAARSLAVVFGLIAACAPSDLQAAAVNVPLAVGNSWKDTGVMVRAGDTVYVETRGILMFWGALSVNSNGEWLYGTNGKYTLSTNLTYGQSANNARLDPARPVPASPGGALVFKIGNGQPFFSPGLNGTPGKDYSAQLGVNDYTKLPGYSAAVVHQFTARETGSLFVSVNLSDKAKGQKLPGSNRSIWNLAAYNLKVWGKLPTECKVSGKLYDDSYRPFVGIEVKAGEAKALSGADGSFVLSITKDGTYPLTVVKTGYIPFERPLQVSIANNETLNLGYIYLVSRPGRVTGRITFENGSPAEKAAVKIGTITAATDNDGRFSVEIGKGYYTLTGSKMLENGMTASAIKNSVQVISEKETNLGTLIAAPAIKGTDGWMHTGRVLLPGQSMVVKAGGEISYGSAKFGPDGVKGKAGGTGSAMPAEAWGSLVAKVGGGKPFLVGKGKTFQAADAGTLYFAVNVRTGEGYSLSGQFKFDELSVLSPGEIEGTVLGAGGKPLTMAAVKVAGIMETAFTDSSGKFLIKDVPAAKSCKIGVTFPGYGSFSQSLPVEAGKRASLGNITMNAVPVKGSIAIKLLPKSGSTGAVIPVFVEVSNTSPSTGLWGGFLISLKAKSALSGKEYPGMAPTYLVLAPGEKRGTELMCQLPAAAPAGDYLITAELRVPETVSIQDAGKQFQAKKDLEGQLSSIKEIKGLVVSQDAKNLNVITGQGAASAAQAAKLLIPTITPKVFSPSKGQVVTGLVALREKAVMIMGKELKVKGQTYIWNSYQHMVLKPGQTTEKWVSIGQSNSQSDDFTVYWDTSKIPDGDYLIKATMKTTYDGKPIEGSMTLMVKVRNDPRTGSIRGKVTDEDGLPLQDAVVKMLARSQAVSPFDQNTLGTNNSVEWQAEEVVRTAADGSYVLDGMVSGDYKLQYSLDNYSQAAKEADLAAGQALSLPAVSLIAGKCRLEGTVRLDDGASPAGIPVSLAGPSQFTATAGLDGRFSFSGVKKGAYTASASKDKYNPATASFACAPGETKAIQGLILAKKVYSVLGTAKDEAGRPLAGVAVTMDKSAYKATTGEDGRFSIINIPVGSHVLAFAKAKYEPAEKRFETASSTGSYAAEANVVLKQANGALSLTVIPAAAQLFIDGVEAQLQGNKYEAALTPGEHTVRALKKAFDTYEERITIQTAETLTREIKLAPSKGDFRLKLEPKDAQASLDGLPVTNNGGEAKVQVLPGKHLLMVYAQGRQSFEKEIEIRSGEETAMEVTLPFLPARLQVSVTPADAEFSIDGGAVQLSGGKYEGALTPGEHAVKALKNKFDTFEGKVTVRPGETTPLDITLPQSKGTLAGTVSPADAQVLIDGTAVQLQGGKFTAALAPGEHAVKALKDKFDAFDGKTTILPAEATTLDIKLPQSKGTLAGSVEPASAQLSIDGVAVELKGNKYEAALAPGEHIVKALKAKFDTFEQKVTILPGELLALDIKLSDGYDKDGYDRSGYDRSGFNKDGYDLNGFNKDGFNVRGFNREGYDKDGYDQSGFNKEGYDKAGFNKEGYDKAGYNKEGYDRNGFNQAGFDNAGYDKAGYDKDGYNKSGFNIDGYDKAGFNKEGYDRNGFNKDGYDKAGYNKEGYDRNGFNQAGFDKAGYDKAGFDKDGYNKSGFNADGYNKAGFDKSGYDKAGFDKDGYNKSGFNAAGYNRAGFDKDGYDRAGFNAAGLNRAGFDKDGYDKAGFNADGFNKAGFNKDGYDRNGFNQAGFDKAGYDKAGYDKDGYNKSGFNAAGFNKAGFDKDGYDKTGFNADGFNKAGFNKDGYDRNGFNASGFDKAGYDKAGYDKDGYNKSGFNAAGFNKAGFDKDGYDKTGFNTDGFNKAGFNKDGYDRNGFNASGFDKAGFNSDGFNKAGFNKDGYDRNGFNQAGFDRSGYDKDGYNKSGFNAAGFNKAGFDKDGYDKAGFNADGFNKAGFNKDGYDRNGFNQAGFDKAGYDKAGYDKDGYNKSGFNAAGYNKAGFDKDGYDKAGFNADGFNKAGFNKDGYDRNGFNQAGFDKAGYDKADYDKDGYNKSGFNKDGYDRNGFNAAGFDKAGYDKAGYDKDGYNKSGFNAAGFNKAGFDKDGYDKAGFNADGFNKAGFNKDGYDRNGFSQAGFDKAGYDKAGYDKDGYNKSGFNKDGYDRNGFNASGFDRSGYDKAGFNADGYSLAGFDKTGYNKEGYDKAGLNKKGYRKGEGSLTVKVDPADAQLLIDGKAVQLAAGKFEVKLAVGEHTVKALKDKFYAFDGKAAILASEAATLDIKLVPLPAPMALASPLGGEAWTAGSSQQIKWTGGSPSWPVYISVVNGAGTQALKTIVEATANNGSYAWKVDMPAGSYLIYVQGNRGKADSSWAYGKPFTVVPQPGTLELRVEPADAQVFIDSAAVQLQGNKYTASLAPGVHTVKALKDKFISYDGKVTIQSGVAAAFEIKLAQSNASLSLIANRAQALVGETVTLTVQTPAANTEVELAAGQGRFEGTDTNLITGRSDAKGKFEAKWASQTPAKHRIKLKAGKGAAAAERDIEVEVKYITPEVEAIIKNVKGGLSMGANLTVEAQARNNGKVSGRYRFELELRGKSNFPLITLKPMELELAAGQSKPLKFDWHVTSLSEYTAKLVVYLVGDKGELKLVNTYQAQLKFTVAVKK